MNVKAVVVLEEAIEDLEEGRMFYESREVGIGDYFIDSLLSDINSLKIYAGVHSVHLGFYRMLSKRFPFAIYYEIVEGMAKVQYKFNSSRSQNLITHVDFYKL